MTADRNALNRGLLLGWTKSGPRGEEEGVWDDGNESHLITIAPTGAGKGVSCIIPALLTWHGPAIVIDPKGENYAVTARHRRRIGQRVYVLDPFRITAAPKRDALNPLDLLQSVENLEEDGATIASLLITWQSDRDFYWDERASSLINQAIEHVILWQKPAGRTLAAVRRVVEHYAETADAKRLDARLSASSDSAFAPVGMATERTRAAIVSTACAHLSFIHRGGVEASLDRSTIDLNEVLNGVPATIYIVVPPDRLISHGKLLRVWLGVLLKTVSRRVRRPKTSTLFLVDEAAQLGELNEIRSSLTLLRGYGLKLHTFFQDLAQLRRVYPKDWESLLSNSGVQQIFGLSNPYVAAQTQSYLSSVFSRPLSSLKPDDMILIRPGKGVEVVRRPDYRNDRLFSGLADPNPFHLPEQPPLPANDHNVIPFAPRHE